MVSALMGATGVDGHLDLFEDRVVIKRKGYISYTKEAPHEDREVPLDQITSIQYKKAGMAINGYIQIDFAANLVVAEEQPAEEDDEGEEKSRKSDSIMFNARQETAFEEIRVAIESKLALAVGKRHEARTLRELEILEKLLNKGLIDKAEFDATKGRILNS